MQWQYTETDFVKSLHQISLLFDGRSLKHRELIIITNAQNQKNYWNSGSGYWQQSEINSLKRVLTEFEYTDGSSVGLAS